MPGAAPQHDRVPPANLDAEVSVVGSMLLSRDAIAEVTEVLIAEDFYRGAHRTMFEAIRDLYDRGEPVDSVTLADELDRRGRLDDVGGALAIADLVAKVPTAANALYYARIVADHALRRRLIDAGIEITKLGYDAPNGPDEAVDRAEALVYQVAQRHVSSEFTPMKDLLTQSFELIEKLHENNSAITGLATGFHDLDELTAGLQPSNLVILAARPSMGKSTMVMNMASHVAVELRKPVVMFSLEMSKMELVQRVLAAEAKVDSDRLRTGRLHENDWPKLSQAMGKLAEAPLFIDDTPGITLMEIRSKARRLKQKHGLDLLIVDYLQLMQSHRRVENRVQEVSELSRGLKILAKELDIPVVALSQLSRRPEDRTDRRPHLADLRESGCLTGDARVLRADNGAEVTMEELYRTGARDIPVWTVDHDYRLRLGRMTHVFPTGTKKVYALRLASGRTVKASANHPFLTLDGWRRLDELAPGVRLAVPRRMPAPILEHRWDEAEILLLAHLIGDGGVVRRQPLHYTSNDLENIAAVEAAAAHFGVTPRRVAQKTWWHVSLPAPHRLTPGKRNPIAAWLDTLGLFGKRSGEKFVPQAVFGLDNRQVALFLRHLWATGGHLSLRDGVVSCHYATTSLRLADDVQALLLRFGIRARIRATRKGASRSCYQVWVYGADAQRRFIDDIGLHGRRGAVIPEVRQRLDGVIPNPNVDTVPVEIWSRVRGPRQARGLAQRSFAAGLGAGYSGSSYYSTAPSRGRLATVARVLDDEHLALLSQSDLFWDEITEIAELGMEPVYDATVADTHNFIANGIIVENSIEQDADLVAFIYRDEVYDPDSPAKGEAELIVAKHRNGPLRTVRLSFIGHHSRFASLARGAMPGGAAHGAPPTGPMSGPM